MSETNYPHVVYDEKLRRWFIDRVPVSRIYTWHRRGTLFEVLCKRYPGLSPAQLLTALAFGYDNQDVMAAEEARIVSPENPKQGRLF